MMTAILKSIHRLEDKFDRSAERFAFRHPHSCFFGDVYRNANFYFNCSCRLYHHNCLSYGVDFRMAVTFFMRF